MDFHRRIGCTSQGRGMSKARVALSNCLEGARMLVLHPIASIARFAERRTVKTQALDRKPAAGQWDSVRAGSAWHSHAKS